MFPNCYLRHFFGDLINRDMADVDAPLYEEKQYIAYDVTNFTSTDD